ncbi:MAG: ice-binding family protein [Fibrobacteria bacterium]
MKKSYLGCLVSVAGLVPVAVLALALALNLSMIGCVSEMNGESNASNAGPGSIGGNEEALQASLPNLKTSLKTNRMADTRLAAVNLGKAGEFVILAKTGISTTGHTAVTGDIGVSPAAATYITGFSLLSPPSAYSTSSLVTGKVYAADYASPTPANLTTAVLDMQSAYTDAAGRAAKITELGAGNIGGRTLTPGVYKWSGNVVIPTDVTLTGSSNDIWILEIAGNLTLSSSVRVTLQGGALPKNIYWQVAGIASLGTTAHIEGIVLSKTAIVLKTGASANGRLLAQTAVTLDANAVAQPAH